MSTLSDLGAILTEVAHAIAWYKKVWIEDRILVSGDALHVIVGPVLQIAAAACLRTNLASLRPLIVVVIAEILNEVNDLWEPRPNGSNRYGESATDFVLTLTLPLLLLLIAKIWPGLLAGSNDISVPQSETSRPVGEPCEPTQNPIG